MIEKVHPKLSVGAQCRLLSISRSSFYYAPQGETAMNLDLMLKVDKRKRVSNTLEAEFCLEALNEAIHKFGPPEIMNMEHGRAIGSSGHATSRQPVHVLRLDRPVEARRHKDLDGRKGPISGQHLYRATLAIPEIRMRLPARLGNRITGQGRRRAMDHLLQPPTATCRPWRTTARRGLLQRNPNRSAGAGSSLDQPEICPRLGE